MIRSDALRRRERRQALLTVVFTIISVLYLMPVFLVLINSLKANAFVNTETFKLPTAESFVGLKNYVKGMTFGNFAFYKVVFYSFFITIASTSQSGSSGSNRSKRSTRSKLSTYATQSSAGRVKDDMEKRREGRETWRRNCRASTDVDGKPSVGAHNVLNVAQVPAVSVACGSSGARTPGNGPSGCRSSRSPTPAFARAHPKNEVIHPLFRLGCSHGALRCLNFRQFIIF